MNKSKMVRLLAGALLSAAATGAMAEWNFSASSGSTASYTVTDTASTVKATATAAYLGSQYFTSSASTAQSANLGYNGSNGLGVLSGGESGSPNHAVDNADRTDLLMFSFTSLVELDLVKLGWVGCTPNQSGGCATPKDADFNVLYNDKLAAGASYSLVGKNWATLQADGWKLISTVAASTEGTYGVNGENINATAATTTKGNGAVASWWIVSAFNTGFGGTVGDTNSDYFKLASLTGAVQTTTPPPPGKVPEPGSLALMGLAVMGLAATRRRKLQG